MSGREVARKALAVMLVLAGAALFVYAVATFNEVNQHSTFAALFGAPALAAFCGIGALVAWTGEW